MIRNPEARVPARTPPPTPRGKPRAMQPNAVQGRVRELLAEVVDLDPRGIGADTTFADLGVDSVAALELVARLEEAFDLRIPEGDALHLTTVDAVVRYVTRNAGR